MHSAHKLYTWTSPDRKHQNQIDFIMIKLRWKSLVQLATTRPGADCSSDHELLVSKVKIRIKLMKRQVMPTRFDLTRISQAYRVDIKNRFNAIDQEDKKPEDLWQELKSATHESAKRGTITDKEKNHSVAVCWSN